MSSSVLSAASRALKGASIVSLSQMGSQWTTNCEARQSNLQTRMTSIGRFSYDSETSDNPSVPSFFIAMSGPKPFSASEFVQLWQSRGVSEKHPRFEQSIDADKPGYFGPASRSLEDRVTDTFFPHLYRTELAYRLSEMLTKVFDVHESLWEAQVTSGLVGTSGAISQLKTENLPKDHTHESLIIFRSHHALADGASLTAAFLELCEEAEDLKEQIKAQMRRRQVQAKPAVQKLLKWLQGLIWMCQGILQTFFYQFRLAIGMPNNPFDLVLKLSGGENINSFGRSISWCDAAPVDEVKQIARTLGRTVTVNDVWVSCVSFAIAKQLEQHRRRLEVRDLKRHLPMFPHINIVVPVHLAGGVLPPNRPIGNLLGAFGARIPGEVDMTAHDRLQHVHDTLLWVKKTPAPLVGYMTARLSSMFPMFVTKYLFRRASANACASISNVRGSPIPLHIEEHTIQSMMGFLPLPPGIPIGVVILSYAGNMSLSVTAQKWAVPDGDQFLLWVLEEYQRLLKETGAGKR